MTTLLRMYESGAITADHFVVESLCLLDPLDPAQMLGDLSDELLQRVLQYAQEYRPGQMRTNYGHQPTAEQVQAARQWIDAGIRSSRGRPDVSEAG